MHTISSNSDLPQATNPLYRGVIAEKASDDLFVLDTAGSTNIQATYNRKNKPLKADQILAERSAIPAFDSRKRKTTDGVVAAKRRKTGVSHKDYDRLRAIAYGGDAVHKDVVETGTAAYDPWNTEEISDPRLTFLEKKKPIKEPETKKQAPVSLLVNGKTVPAVQKPEAGKSYNPTFEDWDQYVQRAGKKEVEAERKRLAIEAVEEELQGRVDAIIAAESDGEKTDAENSAWGSEWEGIDSEDEEAEKLKQKRPERKTQAERNKIKRRKEAERKAAQEQHEKEKLRQLQQIKALAKANSEEDAARKAAKKAAKKDLVPVNDPEDASDESEQDGEEVLRRRRFGKVRVPQAPLEVVLADELQDSLRLLKPEGNLLKDRFRSMQVRGKIETRNRIPMPRQPKRTYTEKWSYKDWKLR